MAGRGGDAPRALRFIAIIQPDWKGGGVEGRPLSGARARIVAGRPPDGGRSDRRSTLRRLLYLASAPNELMESWTSTRWAMSEVRDIALSNDSFDFAGSPLRP